MIEQDVSASQGEAIGNLPCMSFSHEHFTVTQSTKV
jgi:hypothetical protein